MREGMADARRGHAYPGSHRSLAYRFGFDTEATALGRLPEPAWLMPLIVDLLQRMEGQR